MKNYPNPQHGNIHSLILLVAFLAVAAGCVAPYTPPTSESLYVAPLFVYLRQCPEYACPIVGELYKADQVIVLEQQATGWCRVQGVDSKREGWLQRELLSRDPAVPEKYYVTGKDVPLREGPGKDFPFRVQLQAGDRVQKIDQQQGWWRVLADKDKNVGWVPATVVALTLPTPAVRVAAPQAVLYVAVPNLPLHSLPLFSSKVIKEVQLNDKMEKLAESGPSWFRVRHLASGAEGWVQASQLQDSPADTRPPARKAKAKSRKKAATPQDGPSVPAAEPSETPESVFPEAM